MGHTGCEPRHEDEQSFYFANQKLHQKVKHLFPEEQLLITETGGKKVTAKVKFAQQSNDTFGDKRSPDQKGWTDWLHADPAFVLTERIEWRFNA